MESLTEFEKRFRYDANRPQKSGGQAVIYVAKDIVENRTVGLKRASVTESYSVQKEFELAREFNHPNLLKYYDVFRLSTNMGWFDYGVMEWVERGLTLEQYYKSNQAKPFKKDLLKGILEGLDYLHQKDVVHRDLKPSNILIQFENGRPVPKIIDFGVSKQMSGDLTSHSMIVGTPSFMPPEQLLPRGEHIHPNCDLWSFGVIVFTLEIGRSPFGLPNEGYYNDQIRSNILNGNILVPYNSVEEPFRKIIERCLVKDPGKRVKSASELLSLLKQSTQPPGPLEEFNARYKYNPNNPHKTGGQAVIYVANDVFENRRVGIKRAAVTESYSVQKEFELARKFDHPNLLKYYQAFRLSTSMGMFDYGVMEWVEHGLTLEQYYKSNQAKPFKKDLIKGILKGLDYLHQRGVVHRDLKPSNILIQFENGKPVPKIIDFGVSKQMSGDLTSHSMIVGTHSFMPPEQLLPRGEHIHPNCDLWSFGVILFTLEVGKSPFGLPSEGYSNEQIQSNILNGKFLISYDRVDESYREVIKRCLVIDPQKRVKSVAELLRLLDRSPGPRPSPIVTPTRVFYAIATLCIIAVNGYFIDKIINQPEILPTPFIVLDCGNAISDNEIRNCSREKIKEKIGEFITYPKGAEKLTSSKEIEATFYINTNGSFERINILTANSGIYGEIVKTAIEKAGWELSPYIKPATEKGQKVPVVYTYKHTFSPSDR